MNRTRPLILIIFVLAAYMILNSTVVNLLANVGTMLRKDNRLELYETTYKAKIEELEREILNYETASKNLNIYDGESFILTKIALRDIYDIYDYCIVSTPSKVSVGDVAMNEDGLVGIVTEVTQTSAKIALLTGKPKISVKVGENYGVLSEYDRETNEFLIHNIDNYKVINVGDEVTTSGFQEIKDSLPIGEVSSVDVKGVEKIVRVKPYVDFANLNYLFIAAK